MCVPSGVECVSQLGKRDQTPDPSLELAHSHSLVRRWRRNHVLRAQGAHGGPLGCAGPVIYNTVPASAFNDITVGTIGFYVATPGWDYTTGRGTPNISAFVSDAQGVVNGSNQGRPAVGRCVRPAPGAAFLQRS
jgi:hypothetical protein